MDSNAGWFAVIFCPKKQGKQQRVTAIPKGLSQKMSIYTDGSENKEHGYV